MITCEPAATQEKKKSNKTEIFSYRYCHQGWSQWWSRSICCTDGGQTRSDVFSKHMTPCAAVNPCTTLADVSGHTQRSPYGNNIYVYTHTHTRWKQQYFYYTIMRKINLTTRIIQIISLERAVPRYGCRVRWPIFSDVLEEEILSSILPKNVSNEIFHISWPVWNCTRP